MLTFSVEKALSNCTAGR